jgi:basic membrane lipoprotein Med (substrate-binding protein (PBP1-ABC) superfamily)
VLVALCAPALALGKGSESAAPTKVAFVLLGGVDDQGWTAAHAKGIEQLRREMGQEVEISLAENVSDTAQAEAVFRRFARQGNQLIFGTTFQHMDAINAVAAEFPGVVFMHCSGVKTRPNLGVYMARIEQGEYLAGYLAGLMGYHNVGTVATQPIPEVVRGINAFTLGLSRGLREAGVKHDADRLNTVVWLMSWRDAEGEGAPGP